MEAVLERRNMQAALRRVKRNRGSPGVDGMTVEELVPYLRDHWEEIKSSLLDGSYAAAGGPGISLGQAREVRP